MSNILDIPLEELKHSEIDARLWTALMNGCFATLREAQSASDETLMRLPGFGRGTLNRLRSSRFQDPPKDNPRNAEIITRRENGETYEAIAKSFDLTVERLRQVVAQHERWKNGRR